jgi:hypothetical protein
MTTGVPALGFMGNCFSGLAQKPIRIGRDISPSAAHSRRGEPCSPWREFSFALPQIRQAIEPRRQPTPQRRDWLAWTRIRTSYSMFSTHHPQPAARPGMRYLYRWKTYRLYLDLFSAFRLDNDSDFTE